MKKMILLCLVMIPCMIIAQNTVQNKVFTNSEGQNFYSYDGGKTWTAEKRNPVIQPVNKVFVNSENEEFVSEDGGKTWSRTATSIVGQIADDENLTMELSPNPADDQLRMILQTESKKEFELKITDLNGALVRESSGNHLSESGELLLDVSDLSTGVYLIFVHNSEFSAQSRFMISKN